MSKRLKHIYTATLSEKNYTAMQCAAMCQQRLSFYEHRSPGLWSYKVTDQNFINLHYVVDHPTFRFFWADLKYKSSAFFVELWLSFIFDIIDMTSCTAYGTLAKTVERFSSED